MTRGCPERDPAISLLTKSDVMAILVEGYNSKIFKKVIFSGKLNFLRSNYTIVYKSRIKERVAETHLKCHVVPTKYVYPYIFIMNCLIQIKSVCKEFVKSAEREIM